MRGKVSLSFVILLCSFRCLAQEPYGLTVQAGKPLAAVPPTLWGIFFEDINFAADGGLYAELVKNRSFEFYEPLMGWKEIGGKSGKGRVRIMNRGEAGEENNPRYASIVLAGGEGNYGLANEGFRGMGVWKNKQYDFSVLARAAGGDVRMHVQLIGARGDTLGEAPVYGFTDQWKQHGVSFRCDTTEAKAALRVWFEGTGTLDIDMVSLFPHDTWKNRPYGLRSDLVAMLAALKPGFIRFPGGCIVEGHDLATRYQWKKTVGYPEERTPLVNRWNAEFPHRQAPDYFQSFGLGFFEYFMLAEDLGAEPLPVLNCGMACQYNTAEMVPAGQLDPYIQDALDLIEFANGPVTSRWGRVRAGMGHPAPFNMKLLGIGNEQWGDEYVERYREFARAIGQAYPQIQLIAGAGPAPEGERFDALWDEWRALKPGFVDEHYYKEPAWFLNNAKRYDGYDRGGPGVMAGEYAAHTKEAEAPESRNNWGSALAEAAFMTGLERNAGIVHMASYAPLFAHVDAWQWRPDLIWFDNLRVMATPNYYVQKLFSTNRGTHVIPALHEGGVPAGEEGLYASAVTDSETGEVIIKIINTSPQLRQVMISLEGVMPGKKKASVQTLWSPSLTDFNSIEHPYKIVPVEKLFRVRSNEFTLMVGANSVTVVRIPCKAN